MLRKHLVRVVGALEESDRSIDKTIEIETERPITSLEILTDLVDSRLQEMGFVTSSFKITFWRPFETE